MRMNPEVEIKELNAIIAQLTERAEKAERERDALAAHIGRLTSDIHELMDNSDGVAGLHLNGDMAPWSELKQGGRLESWLLSLEDAPEASLAKLIAEKQSGVIEELASHMERNGYSDEAAGVRMWARCRQAEEGRS